VHYHFRNRQQLLQKTRDNVVGFGYLENDRKVLEECVEKKLPGNHHCKVQLTVLDGTFEFPKIIGGEVDLTSIVTKIRKVTTKEGVLGVISRFNENLNWMQEHPFNQLNYIVYNKGTNTDFCTTNVVETITLPNVGRCDHTYIYHIHANYNKLAHKVIVFLPGSIDLAHKKPRAEKIVNHAISKMRPGIVTNGFANLSEFFKDFSIDSYESQCPENAAINNESALILATPRPFGEWYKTHFGDFVGHFYGYYGIFSVSPQSIVQRTKEEYKRLLDELEVGSNVEVGHYTERAWVALFKNMIDPLK
jgi:hypothetical protein